MRLFDAYLTPIREGDYAWTTLGGCIPKENFAAIRAQPGFEGALDDFKAFHEAFAQMQDDSPRHTYEDAPYYLDEPAAPQSASV